MYFLLYIIRTEPVEIHNFSNIRAEVHLLKWKVCAWTWIIFKIQEWIEKYKKWNTEIPNWVMPPLNILYRFCKMTNAIYKESTYPTTPTTNSTTNNYLPDSHITTHTELLWFPPVPNYLFPHILNYWHPKITDRAAEAANWGWITQAGATPWMPVCLG